MSPPRAIFTLVALVLASEAVAAWWMSPNPQEETPPVLEWDAGEADWDVRYDIYNEVETPLRCSSGWVGETTVADVPARVSFFRWDGTSTTNTLEAFKHLPEQCMGAVGMDLEEIYPRRRLEIDGRALYFDSTRFRATGGGPAMHVFKCIWVGGHDEVDLRAGLAGSSGEELRRLRFAAAATRFRPAHTRVVMGGVSGLPSEALAWNEFRHLVKPHLKWVRNRP